MNLLAVDPGGTCGLAHAVIEKGQVVTFASHELEPFDALDMIWEMFENPTWKWPNAIAYETFTPRPGVYTWQPDAVYTIGAMRWMAQAHDVPIEGQSPADAKRFASKERLMHLGWRRATRGGHADDAARHLLLLAVRHNFLDPAVLL